MLRCVRHDGTTKSEERNVSEPTITGFDARGQCETCRRKAHWTIVIRWPEREPVSIVLCNDHADQQFRGFYAERDKWYATRPPTPSRSPKRSAR